MQRQTNETAMEFLRRVVDNLNHEYESILDDLPTVEAVLGYAKLWTVYRTEFLNGIYEAIECDGDDPQPLIDFIKLYNLNWRIPLASKQET